MSKFNQLLNALRSGLAFIVIPVSIAIAYFIYYHILGDPANFVGNDPVNEPLKNNYLGVIYKGGPIVILLISFQIILLTYIIERFFSVSLAVGKVRNEGFVRKVKQLVRTEAYEDVLASCDRQRGALVNVIRCGVDTFLLVKDDRQLRRDQKLAAIERDFEEATQLEIPQLQKNMVIISTLASISTLIGLLGTVTGMIKAFSALARVGSPDAVGLAGGISQALVMELVMPVPPDHEDEEQVQAVRESQALTVILGNNDEVFWFRGITDPKVDRAPFSQYTTGQFLQELKDQVQDPVILIKPEENSRYENLIDLLDEINSIGIARYAITDFTEADREILASFLKE